MTITADAQLIVAAAKGDKSAFGSLYSKYIKKVYFQVASRVSDRQTAEDITSDVFTNMLTNLDNYNSRYAVSTWISAITKHKLADHFRKVYQTDISQLDEEITGINDDLFSDDEPEAQHDKRIVTILDKLPENYQKVMRLRFINGYKLSDIATELGLTLNNVKVIQNRALKQLRDIYLKT